MANNYDSTIDLDPVFAFLAVLDAKGFRAAAKRLRLSPSTVSERIAQLEAQLGVPLLIRTTRRYADRRGAHARFPHHAVDGRSACSAA